ncbi:hypothetical protein ACTXJG_09800 [Glutamicibacter arilaitensis]|jgi:hypothetical protein|nr:hypothetical protein [Glutamicibacter arilaitensis]CBT76395.1 hypothetical protein AARI_21750 [Glutamicibacter arilaitensis Re117]
MYSRRGNNWSLAINTNQNMLMALYLRELSGVHPAEAGPNSKLASNIKNRNIEDDSHGQLKQEWSSWWDSLTTAAPADEPSANEELIRRLEDEGYPALARLARAHYGQATVFAQQHAQDFAENSGQYVPQRMDELERILIDHGVEHESQSCRQEIQLIDVPLGEPRAWLTGTATIVASTSLLRDSKAFQGFIQPMVTIIFPGG